MKIYWIRAQAPRRVLALAKHLGIEADCIEIDLGAGGLKAPSYLALNPNGKAPTMVDGEVTLWESSAIMAYLCAKVGSDMWPVQQPADQIEILRWLSWNDNHWSRAVGPFYFEHVIKPSFHIGEPDPAELAAAVPGLHKVAPVLEGHLASRDFVACGRLTIADFQLASMACDWRQAEMPFDAYPNITRWLDRLMAIPAWAEPWPTKANASQMPALANA
ncbi:glutathione S-transferase family protein [Frateuria edaphi]|uniref:glutathione S-transferase family protein n=1 Tax=Frateuria edaphi TaxID=2898793 RepID=UPI001E6482F1|nr:glutathione S-transferase family protein [Frateuria edaphi]UGB45132.1 glutathione S-transferase family protein [Frateuria edaphi]